MERVRQNFGPVILYFPGYDRDGFFNQRLDIGFLIAQHVDGAARVESADDHIDPGSAELSSQVEGPWKLVGLDSHQPDHKLGRTAPAPADNFFYREFFCSLVKGDDLYPKGAEYTTAFYLFGQTVQDVERVAREHAFPKANHITVVVVLGGFDQDDTEFFERQLWRWLPERIMPARKLTQHILCLPR